MNRNSNRCTTIRNPVAEHVDRLSLVKTRQALVIVSTIDIDVVFDSRLECLTDGVVDVLAATGTQCGVAEVGVHAATVPVALNGFGLPVDAHVVSLSNSLKQVGKIKEALQSYKASINIKPNDTEVLINYGNALKESGKFKQAIECYTTILEVNPNLTEVQNNLDFSSKEKTKIDNLLSKYMQDTQSALSSKEAINFLGTILHQKGYFDEAIENYENAIKIDKTYSTAHNNKGISLNAQGAYAKAIESFDEATLGFVIKELSFVLT